MNYSPYLHLLWKEYRAIRLFWLCLVGLVIFIQWIASVSTHASIVAMEFNLALLALALFALGCAGTAFALEKEDGTFDFLQTIPVTSRQLFVSKLLLTVLATLAMYLLLWLAAMSFTGHALPMTPEWSWSETQNQLLSKMLGLWLVAALEAIAWGTLFSLITARPLLAICLAVTIGSTVTHLLASQGHVGFDMAFYAQAAPARLLVAAIVGAVDICLGLNWLHCKPQRNQPRDTLTAGASAAPSSPIDVANVDNALAAPERSAMLTHLLWQHCRQSGWLMIFFAIVYTAVVIGMPRRTGIVLTPFLAALMGAFVFRADQERRRYRFFAEHNVPPRLVWISRQLPWLITLLVPMLVSLIFVMCFSRFALALLHQLDYRSQLEVLNFGLYIFAGIGLAYCAGQWTSMFIRSGLLAGSAGVLLATLLFIWTGLMDFLRIPWSWSVLPIPLVLMLSTWLRAPDWIGENTTRRARLKAAAIVLVPTAALLIAVPLVRVYGIPLVSPGFDPAQYLAGVSEQSTKTINLYRQLGEELTRARSRDVILEFRHTDTAAIAPELRWLNDNAALVPEILEVIKHDPMATNEPTVQHIQRMPYVHPWRELIWLIMLTAQKLENEKNLAESLDYHLAALRMVSHLSQASTPLFMDEWVAQANAILDDLRYWAAAPGQSPATIRTAIGKLAGLSGNILHLDDSLKDEYILELRQLADESMSKPHFSGPGGDQFVFADKLLRTLMPWEKYHRMRLLNRRSNEAQEQFRHIEQLLKSNAAVGNFLPPPWIFVQQEQSSSILNLWVNDFSYFSAEAPRELVKFETTRRAMMIVLALEAYRLDHKQLPKSLDELAPAFLENVPLDPYSGRPFVYFPEGIPQPLTELQAKQLQTTLLSQRLAPTGPLTPGKPCIWCTGPELIALQWDRIYEANKDIVYYSSLTSSQELPIYEAWAKGWWFPIPKQQ